MEMVDYTLTTVAMRDILSTAPPHLNDVNTCKGINKSACSSGTQILPPVGDSAGIDISTSFDGNGPFSVQWYHNGTEYNCSVHRECTIYKMRNRQVSEI